MLHYMQPYFAKFLDILVFTIFGWFRRSYRILVVEIESVWFRIVMQNVPENKSVYNILNLVDEKRYNKVFHMNDAVTAQLNLT